LHSSWRFLAEHIQPAVVADKAAVKDCGLADIQVLFREQLQVAADELAFERSAAVTLRSEALEARAMAKDEFSTFAALRDDAAVARADKEKAEKKVKTLQQCLADADELEQQLKSCRAELLAAKAQADVYAVAKTNLRETRVESALVQDSLQVDSEMNERLHNTMRTEVEKVRACLKDVRNELVSEQRVAADLQEHIKVAKLAEMSEVKSLRDRLSAANSYDVTVQKQQQFVIALKERLVFAQEGEAIEAARAASLEQESAESDARVRVLESMVTDANARIGDLEQRLSQGKKEKAEEEEKFRAYVALHSEVLVDVRASSAQCGRSPSPSRLQQSVAAANAIRKEEAAAARYSNDAFRARLKTRAVTKLQAAWRGFLIREKFVAAQEQLAEETRAATLFQAAWRGFLAREEIALVQDQCAAATSLQAAWRGFLARADIVIARDEVAAARRIQALWRGVTTRTVIDLQRQVANARGVVEERAAQELTDASGEPIARQDKVVVEECSLLAEKHPADPLAALFAKPLPVKVNPASDPLAVSFASSTVPDLPQLVRT
jgi:hypothetical protein